MGSLRMIPAFAARFDYAELLVPTRKTNRVQRFWGSSGMNVGSSTRSTGRFAPQDKGFWSGWTAQ